MAGDGEAVLAGGLLLALLYRGVHELDGAAASGADEMVMMLVPEGVLKIGAAASQPDLAGQPALGEELQGPMYGGDSDLRVLLPDHGIELIGAEMPFELEENPQDEFPLRAVTQLGLGKELIEQGFFRGGFVNIDS